MEVTQGVNWAVAIIYVFFLAASFYALTIKHNRKDTFTLITIFANGTALTSNFFPHSLVQIILCICWISFFKIADLISPFYQQLFFEIPYYCFMVVAMSIFFSWVEAYWELSNVVEGERKAERLLVICIGATVFLLTTYSGLEIASENDDKPEDGLAQLSYWIRW